MKTKQSQNRQHTHRGSAGPLSRSGKVPASDLAIGAARGGPMDAMLIATQGKTLKQWVSELHGWVQP